MPCLPVQALALPELTTMACASPLFDRGSADFHRRGADLVGGEHARDGGRHFGDDQRQVALLAFVRAFARAEAFMSQNTPEALNPRGATIEPRLT